jgi:hypothetical protein
MTPLYVARHPRADNTSGLVGVSVYKRNKKFQAQIQSARKKYHLGYFDSKFAARDAYERERARIDARNRGKV